MIRHKGQTQIESFFEVFGSNFLSYIIDVVFVLIVAPLLGYEVHMVLVGGVVAVLYSIHLVKSFLYRRFWNWLLIKERTKFIPVDKRELEEATNRTIKKYKQVIKNLKER